MAYESFKCPNCGGIMRQTGADLHNVRYSCPYCAYKHTEKMDSDSNSVYDEKRNELMSRVRLGVVDWKTASWDYIKRDIVTFIGMYEAAKTDFVLQMGLIACITNGFHFMDSEKYHECKILYKTTERMYKTSLKFLKKKADAALGESVTAYEEQRKLYKKCRNEYRNTKLLWKGVFFILKKFTFR